MKKHLIIVGLFWMMLSGTAFGSLRAIDVIKAIPLVAITHSEGHLQAANEYGYEMRINPSTGTEDLIDMSFCTGKRCRIDRSAFHAYIGASGFAYQESKFKQPDASAAMIAANAVYKTWYVIGGPKLYTGSDFDEMREKKGHEAEALMYTGVILSTVIDVLKLEGYVEDQNISFIVFDTGAPGIMYSKNF
jgi:hypothetical protein